MCAKKHYRVCVIKSTKENMLFIKATEKESFKSFKDKA